MIKFSLRCTASHEFEGWFRDNASFDEQAKAGALTCPVCGDAEVTKSIMAPAVRTSEAQDAARAEQQAKLAAFMRAVREAHAHVEQNFENVGERFSQEARAIHLGDAERRDIYGQATREEAEALADEGIPFGILPGLPKTDA